VAGDGVVAAEARDILELKFQSVRIANVPLRGERHIALERLEHDAARTEHRLRAIHEERQATGQAAGPAITDFQTRVIDGSVVADGEVQALVDDELRNKIDSSRQRREIEYECGRRICVP